MRSERIAGSLRSPVDESSADDNQDQGPDIIPVIIDQVKVVNDNQDSDYNQDQSKKFVSCGFDG